MGKAVKLQVALDWAARRGAGLRVGRIGPVAAAWVCSAGCQSCWCFTGTM